MTTTQRESLHQIFRDLHAERVRSMDPEKLKLNIDQRAELVAKADPSKWVKVGDRLEPFSLKEVDGGTIELTKELERGPLVLIFFRFEGCPACNLALPYYQRNLWPGLKKLGANLVAVSPQVPEKLVAIKRRHNLEFSVASDLNELGRRFGILYTVNEAGQKSSLAAGRFLGDTIGTGTWELPQPTAVVIDTDRVVRFADVHPDWLIRTEAEPILEALTALKNRTTAELSARSASL